MSSIVDLVTPHNCHVKTRIYILFTMIEPKLKTDDQNMTAGLQTMARELGGDERSFCSESDSSHNLADEPSRRSLQLPTSSFTPPTT